MRVNGELRGAPNTWEPSFSQAIIIIIVIALIIIIIVIALIIDGLIVADDDNYDGGNDNFGDNDNDGIKCWWKQTTLKSKYTNFKDYCEKE